MSRISAIAAAKPSRKRAGVRVRRAESPLVPAETTERILDAAQRVLVTHGHAGFTTRRVAEAAGMAPGNLSYHFPAKRELLRAMIVRLMAQYAQQFQEALAGPGLTPGHELDSLVRWLLTDAVDKETTRMFRELWAVATRDVVVRRALDDFYDELMEGVAQRLLRLRPQADVTAMRELVQVLGVMSEGTSVMYGTRRERAVPHERFIELATRVLVELALPATAPAGKARRTAKPRATHPPGRQKG